MHYEESGEGHGTPGSEACSTGNFLCSKINSGAFRVNVQTVHIFLPLIYLYCSIHAQQYWITWIARALCNNIEAMSQLVLLVFFLEPG